MASIVEPRWPIVKAAVRSKRLVCHARQTQVTDTGPKQALRTILRSTGRGGDVSSAQRGVVEEAKVALETHGGPFNIESLLPGKWRVAFTTAPDVLPLVEGSAFPVKTGNIYQEFSDVSKGVVKNIIELESPLLSGNGATVTVEASYEVRSSRRIALTFKAAELGDIRISNQVETLLAPALLPRTWINHRILLALNEFQLRVKFPQRREQRQRSTGEYLLTYLDSNILIGHQISSGGYFIFERESNM